MVRVLIVAHEPVGTMMTGPAIRCWEISRVLSQEFEVTLAAPAAGELLPASFRVAVYQRDNPASLEDLASRADVILVSGYLLRQFPGLGRLGRHLVVDIYGPFPIENLNLLQGHSLSQRTAIIEDSFQVVSHLMRVGDFFICGSEQQRDFWLGMLAANGRLNPLSYQGDPSFRKLVDVVPMGLPDSPPRLDGPIKGATPGIDPGDFLIVWPGGVWDWLDPLTAIDAVHLLSKDAPDVKLLFPGVRHPHPEIVSHMEKPEAIRRRAESLGLLDKQVFINDWTPYSKRGSYLLEANAAISLHFDCLETRLAIRARLLDCIWAGTPLIATKGDVIAEAMAAKGLARLVPPADPAAVAEAVLAWRAESNSRSMLSAQFKEMANQYRWSVACQPLVDYLRHPHRAADRQIQVTWDAPSASTEPAAQTAAIPARWEAEDLLALPFDQYQRHRQVAQIVEALREDPSKHLTIMDVGGGPAVLQSFLDSGDTVISVDPSPAPDSLAVKGNACHLPFADASFDFAVALDTLEHLASGERLQLIDECLRVARKGVIITGPFASPEAIAAENLLFEFVRCVHGGIQQQLREHIKNGLPERAALEARLQELGYPYLVKPSGYIHRWLTMMLLKHYILSLPDSNLLHRQVDSYYNRFHYWSDQCEPSYRLMVFIAKTDDPTVLDVVNQALAEPDPKPAESSPGGHGAAELEEIKALSQLGLLVSLATMRASGARGGDAQGEVPAVAAVSSSGLGIAISNGFRSDAVSLQQALVECESRLRDRELALAAAQDLLARIAQGRVMRILNGVHSLRRRLIGP